ncbi:electron transfer flavoprotein subunit alpha/FixB family protein [Caproiciproducens sp.]|uniref:electron transfer flavoprotein subunit alpha/FixB family protein n=1 Tax=Caproiciproducens sp. TaxID=1954376 RepID=UPI002898509B|nr:electron transfer flavoprotein subunit alpha/FixB family protein [Caproiciproducens sp.]
MNQDILICLETGENGLHASSLELIGKALELAQPCGGSLYGVVMGGNAERLPEDLRGLPLQRVYIGQTCRTYDAQECAETVVECVRRIDPSVLLISGTCFGRSVAPRIAVACRTGLTADCTELERTPEGGLIQIRPAFGGDIMARIVTDHTRPQMATVRPGVMSSCVRQGDRMPELCALSRKTDGHIHLLDVQPLKLAAGIAAQKVLVAAGRGVKRKEDLVMLEHLAQRMGGALACSRALVEKGLLPHEKQIGLSGATVSPDLLLTCGISGSVQFQAGIRRAKTIIAINSDPEAKIFDLAHIPVCGDLYEIVPKLIERLEKDGESVEEVSL